MTMATLPPDKIRKDAQVLRWAMANRDCTIADVPSWVIMTLLEDVVRYGAQLLEYLVMAVDDSEGIVMDGTRLEGAVEKLMTNVLLSSLHEDGHIEVGCSLLDEPLFFDLHSPFDVAIALTPSGEEAHIGEELELFTSSHRASYQ
jgi:hypothetical protein